MASSPPPTGYGSIISPIDDARRGNYTYSRAGTLIFIALRSIDPAIQYLYLFQGWGSWLLSHLGLSSITSPVSTPGAPLSRHLLVAMSAGVAVKHIYWVLVLNREHFNASMATAIAAGHILFDTAASLLFLFPKTSAARSGPSFTVPGTEFTLSLPAALGTAMFAVGLLVEASSETQRRLFKARPENAGKVYTQGLWSLARHVNYGAYTLWSGGYLLAASGWIASVLVMALLTLGFYYGSIPGFDKYMSGKYREQWTRYKAEVRYSIFPGIL